MHSNSPSVRPFRKFLVNRSILVKNICNISRDVYNISELFLNDLDAIKSRIQFVYSSEERSTYWARTQVDVG